MFSFFRTIRKALFETHMFRMYLGYALGEILLVIIGILIALQINNWNEANQARELELRQLAEIKDALAADYIYFNEHIAMRNGYVSDSIEFFENYILTGELDDTRVNQQFARLGWYFQVQFNASPFDALKSSGLDKITNPDLRQGLVHLYDFIYPRYTQFFQSIIESSLEIFEAEAEVLLGDYELVIIDGKIDDYRRPINTDDLATNPNFLGAYISAKNRLLSTNRYIDEIKIEMLNTIELLDQELESET
ncbi:MAG: DUF6090 family protein [Gammaproteobacteria bacterium]